VGNEGAVQTGEGRKGVDESPTLENYWVRLVLGAAAASGVLLGLFYVLGIIALGWEDEFLGWPMAQRTSTELVILRGFLVTFTLVTLSVAGFLCFPLGSRLRKRVNRWMNAQRVRRQKVLSRLAPDARFRVRFYYTLRDASLSIALALLGASIIAAGLGYRISTKMNERLDGCASCVLIETTTGPRKGLIVRQDDTRLFLLTTRHRVEVIKWDDVHLVTNEKGATSSVPRPIVPQEVTKGAQVPR
jgi:hypothetical protein